MDGKGYVAAQIMGTVQAAVEQLLQNVGIWVLYAVGVGAAVALSMFVIPRIARR